MKKLLLAILSLLLIPVMQSYALEVTGTITTQAPGLTMAFPCNPNAVTNGSVNPDTCAITCDSGYTISGTVCTVISSGGGSGGGGGSYVPPTTQSPVVIPTIPGATGDEDTTETGSTGVRIFSDTEASFARDAIEAMAKKGIIKGYSDGTFRPENPITRAEFLSVTMKSLNIDVGSSIVTVFTDIPTDGSWMIPYIEKARLLGIAQGQTINGILKFRPNDSITRAEAIAILLNAAKISVDLSVITTEFKDIPLVDGGWMIPYVVRAQSLGIINGQIIDGVLKFRPNDSITRAESVKIITKATAL